MSSYVKCNRKQCSHLERNLFEVEFIAHVVVSAHSFRVVVDHDRLVFELGSCKNSEDE